MPVVKISEITEGMSGIEVTGEIVSAGPGRDVQTRYGPARVADAVLKDETGSIGLALWRDQIEMVKPGDMVLLRGAFVRVFRNEMQLNVGRSGEIQVL